MSAPALRVGFIGLGTMGAGMAANIRRAGYPMLVHDLHRQSAGQLLEAGAAWAATPREVAEGSDVVFLSLPGPPEVEAVVFGADGVLEGLRAGMAVFDLSTNSQEMAVRIAAACQAKGAESFDAPVSGGPEGAISGKLAIWVGGDRAAYDRLKPVLDSFGDQAAYIGPTGTATIASWSTT